MKFVAKKSISDKITEGKIYVGNLIWKFEAGNGSGTSELKIVVYNDLEKWSAYSPSYFEPREEC